MTTTYAPACSKEGHGPMVLRRDVTKEQAEQGTWYDCPAPHCLNSVLKMSDALAAEYATHEIHRATGALMCDMNGTCANPVTMLDDKGYVYCTEHGLDRRAWRPCRKLRPHELRRVERGEQIVRY